MSEEQLAFDIEGLASRRSSRGRAGVDGAPLHFTAADYPRRQGPFHWFKYGFVAAQDLE